MNLLMHTCSFLLISCVPTHCYSCNWEMARWEIAETRDAQCTDYNSLTWECVSKQTAEKVLQCVGILWTAGMPSEPNQSPCKFRFLYVTRLDGIAFTMYKHIRWSRYLAFRPCPDLAVEVKVITQRRVDLIWFASGEWITDILVGDDGLRGRDLYDMARRLLPPDRVMTNTRIKLIMNFPATVKMVRANTVIVKKASPAPRIGITGLVRDGASMHRHRVSGGTPKTRKRPHPHPHPTHKAS